MSQATREGVRRGSCLTANKHQLFTNRKDAEMAWQHGYEILEVYVDLP